MRDSIKKHRIKNENTEVKTKKFGTDKKLKIETIDEQLETFAEIIVAVLLKENYKNEN